MLKQLVVGMAISGVVPITIAQEKLDGVEVIGTTPIPGAAVPVNAVPANIQTVRSRELSVQRSNTLADYFDKNFTGAFVNEAQSNPYQPDLNYRGFVASPLLGNPIGLSVYVDGVRINESFGDTVLWDLIPSAAIFSTDLIPGSNPVFGLNTLGGALNIRTRSGRNSPGGEITLEGGSFGRRSSQAAYGLATDRFDFYISAEDKRDDGWRARSPSRIKRFFAKAGWAGENTDFSLSFTQARNSLIGNGLMPESMLAREPNGVYNYPDRSEPRLSFFNATLTHFISDELTLTAKAYRRKLKLNTENGDAEFDDGGTPVDPSDDAYGAEFRRTATDQTTSGFGLQLARDGDWAGRRHRWAAGLNIDRGKAHYRQSEEEAEFLPDRGVEGLGESETVTDINGHTVYQSVYLTDTISFGQQWNLTLSGRYTHANVRIADRSGLEPELNGRHTFSRFSPSLGATYRLPSLATFYFGFNEGFRAPTPVELTCADPDDPCALPVAFIADPPLDPVVARTLEVGLRGQTGSGLRWNTNVYQTNLRDDILFTSTGTSQGFFANIDKTRREGIELSIARAGKRWDWYMNYALTRATYQTDVELFNPVANEADPTVPETISARRGDRLPGVPEHLFKAGLTWKANQRIALGSSMNWVGGQFLRGDEGNDQRQISSYALFNLRASYQFDSGWRFFAKVDNLFDRKYATLGAYNRVAFGADSQALSGVGPGPVERFVSPGAPRSFWFGLEYRFGAQ